MPKFKILENHSQDAGNYSSFKNIRYGEVVEAEYVEPTKFYLCTR